MIPAYRPLVIMGLVKSLVNLGVGLQTEAGIAYSLMTNYIALDRAWVRVQREQGLIVRLIHNVRWPSACLWKS